MERVQINDERMLRNAVKDAEKMAPGVKVYSKLLMGSAGKEIIREAERGHFNLIVIGSRGLSGFSELMLGSVSHRVVNGSGVPVLVVK